MATRGAPSRWRRDRAVIPRTKVNYGLLDLVRAAFTRERKREYAEALVTHLRELTGCRHILLTASGRGALYAILRAVGRERVLIPSYTCKAVDEAVLLAGRSIVRVPTEANGFNYDASSLEELLDEGSVVVATHQFGIPCDMATTMSLARARGALIVEDAAASLGTRIDGKLTGTIGDVGFFSFDSTKLVTVPLKGGFIATDDDAMAQRIARVLDEETVMPGLAWKVRTILMAAILVVIENGALYRLFHWVVFGCRRAFTFDEDGLHPEFTEFYRHRLTNWQARIALGQIRRFDEIVGARQRRYRELLSGLSGVERAALPPEDSTNSWACIRFPLRVRGDKLVYYQQLVDRGVDCAFSFTYIGDPSACERAGQLAHEVLDLPYYEKLTDRELNRVVEAVVEIDSAGVTR